MNLIKRLIQFIIILSFFYSQIANPHYVRAQTLEDINRKFGLGVATHGGPTASSDYGYTAINQNTRDALSLTGLNPNAMTWSVFQLEPNSDINFILASYSNYPQYDMYDNNADHLPNGYNGTDWNIVSSTQAGTPGAGTFVVTHIALNSVKDTVNCGSDGYCIYGLKNQPVASGQDTGQRGGQYLNWFPNKDAYCQIPANQRKYFDNRASNYGCGTDPVEPGYDPVGLIGVPGADLWSSYPNFGSFNIIHDIRVPVGYWRPEGGYIVYGGIYNPVQYKGKNYPEGVFINFVKKYPGKKYALFNFPNAPASKWDSHPCLPASYAWLFKTFMIDGIGQWDPTAQFIVHDGAENEDYPQKLADAWKEKYGTDFPADYWSFTLYGTTNTNDFSDTNLQNLLFIWGQFAESRVKRITHLVNVKSNRSLLLEVAYGSSTAFDANGNLPQNTYEWERRLFRGIGKWLRSLSLAYPLDYFSIQPTYHIPEYIDGAFVPATRQDSYATQILSVDSTGTAKGWHEASEFGGSGYYISTDTFRVDQNPDSAQIKISYYNADGITDNHEGFKEVQTVINSFPDWDGTNVNNSPTKYGVRILYAPLNNSGFTANTSYVQDYEGCAGHAECVYGWAPIQTGNWYTNDTLKFQARVKTVTAGTFKLDITYEVKLLPGSPLSKSLNVYAYAEKISQVDPDPRKNLIDLSAGSQNTYSFANFKKCGEMVIPIAGIPGDLNGDTHVDNTDYQLFLADFGKTGSPGWISADIDKNGKVDIFDYNILVENFGK